MRTGAVETHTIDDSHEFIRYDRPVSGEIERQRAAARPAAEQAILAAVEKPMSRLRKAVEAALQAGQLSVPSDLSPAELAAALPGSLQDALDRMDVASRQFEPSAVTSAAEMASRGYQLPVGSAAYTAQAALAGGVVSARAHAAALVGRAGKRRHELARGLGRVNWAAGFCERKRRELQDAERDLAGVAQEVVGGQPMMEALDKELRELRGEIQPVMLELDKLRRELQAIDMPDHARGGPYVHPHGDDPPEAVAARRRAVVAAIEVLEVAVKAQEQKMVEAARRHADELEHDPRILDQAIDDLCRNAGMSRPPLATASMVLSEARYNNTVYPMAPGGAEEADLAHCCERDRDTALAGWAAGMEQRASASARSNTDTQGGVRATGAGMEYPCRVRSTGAGLIYG